MDKKQQQKAMDRQNKIENNKRNLKNQTDKILRNNKVSSFISRHTYQHRIGQFCEYVADVYGLQKFVNVQQKHITAYIKYRIANNLAGSTINGDLTAIRWFHNKSGSKNAIVENKVFKTMNIVIPPKTTGKVDRAWTRNEIDHAKGIAQDMGRMDAYYAIELAYAFGMRIEEVCTMLNSQIKEALSNINQLLVKGKGNYTRMIPVRNANQVKVLTDCLEYSRLCGRTRASDNVISMSQKNGVKQEKAALENWNYNHRHKWETDFRVVDSVEYDKQRSLCEQAGYKLNTNKISFHGLRYNFAQILFDEQYRYYISKGWSHAKASIHARKDTSEQLGHHRDAITSCYLSGL